MEPTLCFIREEYFKKNSSFVKMLDAGNTDKQSKRTHVCVLIEANNCKCQYKNVQKVENKNVQFSNFYSSACASI